jgi:hypothetical protein
MGMMRLQSARTNYVKRSARRVDVETPSRLRHGDFRQAEVQLANLSFGGFCAKCQLQLEPGDFVSIDLPDIGLVRAKIAWCHGGRLGGAFFNPVDIRRSSATTA